MSKIKFESVGKVRELKKPQHKLNFIFVLVYLLLLYGVIILVLKWPVLNTAVTGAQALIKLSYA